MLGQSERPERDIDPAANHSVRYFRVLLAVIAQNPPRLRARVPHQRPAQPDLVVEIEVTAVKGAGSGIQWIGPDAVDPLDAG